MASRHARTPASPGESVDALRVHRAPAEPQRAMPVTILVCMAMQPQLWVATNTGGNSKYEQPG